MPKKIFELANEYEIKALDLVEKLKAQGFAVRNHMTALSDEDVEKVIALLNQENKSQEDAGATKKKTVRKKTAKKKVVRKTAQKADAESDAEATTDSDAVSSEEEQQIETAGKTRKKITIRKKTLVRKKTVKSDDDETLDAEEFETDIETEEELEVAAETAPEETQPEPKRGKEAAGKKSFGLRVVSRPDAEEVAAAKEAKKSEKKELDEVVSEYDDEDELGKKANKKRMGGLASMMSGKAKGVASKSREITQMRADEELKSYAALNSMGKPLYANVGRKKAYVGPSSKTVITEVKDSKRVIQIHKVVVARDLAQKLSVKFDDLANKALQVNLLLTEGDYLGMKLTEILASLYSYRVEDRAFDETKVLDKKEITDQEKEKLPLRDPIITIMGHVDHGKTTLLDHIRNTKVVEGEAGGITQHIGAYSVKTKDGKQLTFLDTPGHAAFGAMRQRGANVTDIVILVVAADDGVMPQTKESIRFCQNAEVPVLVAVNKMDKEGVNPDRVKQELMEFGLTPEDWGGETQYVHISALKGDGVDELLEAVALLAEMSELRADPRGSAEGVVIESKIETGRGPVATILVQTGTLNKGDSIVVGETFGRARSLMDSTGADLKSAGPSTPVQILGLNDPPAPGDIMNVVKNEREAKKVCQNRIDERKKLESTPDKKKISLEDFFAQASESEGKKILKLVVRADVQGSFEAVKQAVEAFSTDEVGVAVIGGGVGAINDNDVQLAESSQGFIIGFNMRPMTSARRLAEDKGVDVKTYSIIYELINDVKLALEGLLEPEFIEKYIGRAEVRDTFSIPKIGVIAGSAVIDGKIQRGCNIRLLRDGKIVFDGKMSSLKRFKDDVKEVANGYECGIGLEGFNDVKVSDVFEAYLLEEQKRSLELPAEGA